jgi:hypothetical protein
MRGRGQAVDNISAVIRAHKKTQLRGVDVGHFNFIM